MESTDDILSALKASYLGALPSKVDEIESEVLALEKATNPADHYRTLYRYVHSLKGSGGTYGFHILTIVCHQFEDVLTGHGADKPFTQTVIDLFLRYVDILKNTSTLLQSSTTDFGEIEKKLADLKSALSPNRAHVLIVDPSRTVPGICKEALAKYDAQIVVCDDGLTALQRLLHEKFDMLITSKETKTLDGLALISAVRLGGRINKNIHVLLLTSNKTLNVADVKKPFRVVTRDAHLPESLQKAFEEMLPEYTNQ